MEESSAAMESSEVAAPQEASFDSSLPTDTPDDESAEDLEGQEPQDDDGEEIEHDGEKFRVPKKLKDAFLRQSDYTRKTQDIAAQRQAIEQQAQQVRQQAAMQHQHIQEIAEAVSIDRQLEQLRAIDWNALTTSDPVEAMRLDRQMRELTEQRGQIVNGITQRQQQQAMEAQQTAARQLQEAAAQVALEIPNWGPEIQKTLSEYGATQGYQQQELASVADPRAVKLLHKAYLYDQMVAKQAKESKVKPESQEKPVTKIAASKSNTVKDPSKMTDTEFNEWRRKQIARRNR